MNICHAWHINYPFVAVGGTSKLEIYFPIIFNSTSQSLFQEFEHSVAGSLLSFATTDCQTLYRDVEMIREWLRRPPEGKNKCG